MIEPYLTARTKMVFINSPSNPSGAVLDRAEFEKIYRMTAARGIFLLTDECYCHFLYDSEPFSIASLPGAKENVLVAGSLSKTYAMTGWRIGFALAPARVIGAMLKLQSHSTSNPDLHRAEGGGGGAARPAGFGARHARGIRAAARLRDRPAARHSRRAIAPSRTARSTPIRTSAWRSANGISNSVQFAERLLEKAAVAVVPGEAFGTDRHVRISYATSMHELERGLERLHRFIVEQ